MQWHFFQTQCNYAEAGSADERRVTLADTRAATE